MFRDLIKQLLWELAWKAAEEIKIRAEDALETYKIRHESPTESRARRQQQETEWFVSHGQQQPIPKHEWHASNEDDKRLEKQIQEGIIKVIAPNIKLENK